MPIVNKDRHLNCMLWRPELIQQKKKEKKRETLKEVVLAR